METTIAPDRSLDGGAPDSGARRARTLSLAASPSLARPGGNITGVFLDLPEMAGKQLQLLKEIVPSLSRVAVLWHSPLAAVQFRAIGGAARSANLMLYSLPVKDADHLESAVIDAGRSLAGGLVILSSPVIISNRKRIAVWVLRQRLPAISLFTSFPADGLLMAYGPNLAAMYQRCGDYVAKILKSAKPAGLPVERPTTFELVINLKTAKTLGLTIPQSLLLRADEVIK